MEGIYQSGISIIRFFQENTPWLITPMAFFNNFVSEIFYMSLIAAIYWCWNSWLGLRIGLLLILGQGVKSFFKILFHQPRPFWIDPIVQAANEETSFGIPSGHAMDATVVFGGIAAWIGKVWAWIVAILLILYIGVSRFVIGVHFPTDVLAGWLIGAVLLFIYLKLEKPAGSYLKKQTVSSQIGITFLASLAMILLNYLVLFLVGDYSIPETWQTNFNMAFPEGKLDPLSISGVYSYSGMLFGLGLGVILIQKRGGFDAGGRWWKRLVRFLLGIVGLAVIYIALDMIFDLIGLGGQDIGSYIARYVRYGCVGLWAAWIAPLIFLSIKLVEPQNGHSS